MANTHADTLREIELSLSDLTKAVYGLNERFRAIPSEINKNRYLSDSQFEMNSHDSANKYLAIVESLEAEMESIPPQVEALNEQIKTAQEERARLSVFDMSSLVTKDDDLFERCRKLCGK